MLRGRIGLLLLSLLIVAGLSVDARAQAVYGSIAGTVTDVNGAAVPNATVTITSIERKTSDTAQTNDSGLFVRERLLPGKYEVKISAASFKETVIPEVIVNVDTQTKADVALQPGQLSETITISAGEGQLLKTDRADVATTC